MELVRVDGPWVSCVNRDDCRGLMDLLDSDSTGSDSQWQLWSVSVGAYTCRVPSPKPQCTTTPSPRHSSTTSRARCMRSEDTYMSSNAIQNFNINTFVEGETHVGSTGFVEAPAKTVRHRGERQWEVVFVMVCRSSYPACVWMVIRSPP